MREKKRWTQEQLAEKAGCDYKYLQLFELNRTPEPSLRNIEKLATALGVPPWVLLCDEPHLVAFHTGLDQKEFTQPVVTKPGRPKKRPVEKPAPIAPTRIRRKRRTKAQMEADKKARSFERA